MESTFKIDFFEFAFLVEACIPPKPIARTMFFKEVINTYYQQMSINERGKLFTWICRLSNFNIDDKDCLLFHNRFNPDNQYELELKDGSIISAFKHIDNRFYINETTSIIDEQIENVTQK